MCLLVYVNKIQTTDQISGSLSYLGVQPQHEDHEEEADGPKLRKRHQGYSSGVGDEGQARS